MSGHVPVRVRLTREERRERAREILARLDALRQAEPLSVAEQLQLELLGVEYPEEP